MVAQPPTETMKISQVKQGLNALVNRVYRREARILIEKSGIPVAAIVSAQDVQRLERLDRERAERFKILDEIGEAFKDVPVEELEREVARAIAEVRAERRTQAQHGGVGPSSSTSVLPTTETMKISAVKQGLNSLVNRVFRHETHILIEKRGVPVAGIVSVRDLQWLKQLDRERAEHIKALYEFAAGFADQTPEDIERETAKAIAEVRAEKWGERERAVGD